ncbi:MAG: peptidase M23 [Flavobacteriales bacterium]|nr:peptidase M23 [Flavobacteriales bacterium]|tara:strand:- start:757 stop:2466 length:1710 start_codon:yes stop_codon:yes gene_type:complete
MRSCLFCILICFVFALKSQNEFPKGYFRPPLDIPLYLAGNFGELRSNHFHAGIDIKTEGVIGKKVYASAEGYISRIKIQHNGYGKVLYIDHPNGYTTTYAHLHKFSDKLDDFIKKEQYNNKSYTIDWYPDSGAIPVKKGEIIALSGNSGGSGGPHLHFEIRETASEHALNALLFGLPVKDNIKPIIRGIRIYPLDDQSTINHRPEAQYFTAQGNGSFYSLQNTPVVSGKIGFGIETLDKINGASNRCGIFNIKLKIDGQLIYEQKMDRIPFEESLYLNAHTDYHYKKTAKKWIHKSFIEPNNHLSIYDVSEQNGVLIFNKFGSHELEYIVTDVAGNRSTMKFKINTKPQLGFIKRPLHENFAQHMQYHHENEFSAQGFLIQIPDSALYNDIDFKYSTSPHPKRRWSNIHYAHTDHTPLHKKAEIYIKCNFPSDIPTDKLIAIRKTSDGKVRVHVGKYAAGYYYFKSKYFGDFYIYHDTIAPTIKPLNVYSGKNIAQQSKFDFKITDNLAGIKSYNCYIDDKWVLTEYDYKKNRLTHFKHNVITEGKHEMKLIVTDAVGNESVYKCHFYN